MYGGGVVIVVIVVVVSFGKIVKKGMSISFAVWNQAPLMALTHAGSHYL